MNLIYEKMRRLDMRGPASRGVAVDAEGATLGPDCVLVRRAAGGYRCVRREEAAAIGIALFGPQEDSSDRLFVLARGIAGALNQGEVALAQIYGLRIPVAGLDDGQLRKLAIVAPSIKANFNPDQPRLPAGMPGGGEWTDQGGGTGAPGAAPTGATAAAETNQGGNGSVPDLRAGLVGTTAAAEAGASIFAPLGETALAGLTGLAAGMAGAAAVLGVMFVPANGSLTTDDTLPGRPDLTYRYDRDTGVINVYRREAAGTRLVISGHIGDDGRFYTADGRVIGRSLGNMAAVDPGAIPAAPRGQTGTEERAEADGTEGQPRLCPDPTAENITGRSARALAYQTQITGLPPGLDVELNGVRFDGCDETNGHMLEAKGFGFANMMDGPERWQKWFTSSRKIEVQMQRQSKAAFGRIVEWHFAERPVADFFHDFAEKNNLNNVVVKYTPMM